MLNLNSLMIGSSNPKKLAEFYEKVVEKKPDMEDAGNWYGWMVGSCFLGIGPHDKVAEKAQEPARIMFNFETTEVQKEFDRIKELGTTVVKEPYDAGHGMMIATFADPDGNFFQLMPPWEDNK